MTLSQSRISGKHDLFVSLATFLQAHNSAIFLSQDGYRYSVGMQTLPSLFTATGMVKPTRDTFIVRFPCRIGGRLRKYASHRKHKPTR